MIWIPGTVLTAIVFSCFLWPMMGNVSAPVDGNISAANLPMWSHGHLFGTNPVGNDILSQILYGGRVSIEVGLGSNAIGLLGGGLLGILAAYKGGFVDLLITRVLEVFIAFPSLILALVIAEYLGPGEAHVIWALSIFSVPAYARLARAQTFRVLRQPFILAARLSGSRAPRVILAHIAPSVMSELGTFWCLGISIAITVEASLSFLGLGVRLPEPTWGDMIAQGQEYLTTKPNLVLIPSGFLLLTVISINVLGDNIRARMGTR